MKRRNGFTLIEMLIVITVIAILAGISFRLVQMAKRNADRAETIAILERVQHALEEFKAEYGIYPPVQPGVCQVHDDCCVCYQYENVSNQTDWLRNNYFVEWGDSKGGNLFDMGLVSYLVERLGNRNIQHFNASEWVPDTDRDINAKARWQHFLGNVVSSGTMTNWVEGTAFGNDYLTIRDAWDRPIKYETHTPYQTYKLWSQGYSTGSSKDDIHRDGWDD